MKGTGAQRKYFTKALMDWHREENGRSLPWKQEQDPYKIWLSEIILQQTRAEQGLPYYLKFTEKYPGIRQLADAPDEEVFRLWQGLGYYNRCRNLLYTARFIANELDGAFPGSYAELIKLKGVGAYTAAAIASFAFGLPHAVVDGNVNRVLARYFGIDTPFDTTEGKKQFQSLADELLDRSDSAGYNQAIMDMGATVCTPQTPRCDRCPLRQKCIALNHDLIADLPVRIKKTAVKKRYFHYLLLANEDRLWIRKRTGKDIWQGLYEPLLIEHGSALDTAQLMEQPVFLSVGADAGVDYEGSFTQRLTHQLIETRFFSVAVRSPAAAPLTAGEWVHFSALKKYAFPKTIVSYLEKKFYF